MKSVLTNSAVNFTSALAFRVLEVAVIQVACRKLDLFLVGLVFVAEGLAGILFQLADFGLATVLTRRAARRQLGWRDLSWTLALRAGVLAGALTLLAPLGGVFLALGATAGVFRLHELARAVLVGQERFVLNSALGLCCRLLGTALSLHALWGGWGIYGWIGGRFLSEVCQLVLTLGFAYSSLAQLAGVDPAARGQEFRDRGQPLTSEGLTFWARYTLDAVSTHTDVLLGAAYLGPAAATLLGVANRLLGAGLLLAGTLGAVIFPRLARQGPKPITGYIKPAILIAFTSAMGLAALAPPAARWLLHADIPYADATLRTYGLGLFFLSLYQLQVVWLESLDRERRLLYLNMLVVPASVLLQSLLLPHYGIEGAAWAFVGRAAAQCLGAWKATR